MITPNVREEAQLMDSDPLGGSQQTSSSSLEVEPGNDPLSQFSSAGERGGEGGGVTFTNSMRKSESGQEVNEHLHGDRQGGARYGERLTKEDHSHLLNFVYELVGRRLLPHLNEALKSLNEWVSICMYICTYIP